jgi:hypothetical protein
MTVATLRTLARALGGEVTGRHSVNAPGPGHTPSDRSLSVRLEPGAPDGFLVHSHAGDDWVACRDYVRSKLGLPEWQPGDGQDRNVPPSRTREHDRMAVDRQANDRTRTEDDLGRIAGAVKIWDQGCDPRGTVAEDYLRSRALELPPEIAGTGLRFHPRCPWRNENTGKTDRIPALIAAFRSIDDDVITGIHRIRLDQPTRWPKAERKMLGLVRHAAVKLDRIRAGTLLIGEGIETCLAARQLGYRPAWALGSVGAIWFFPVLDNIKRIIIHREPGNPSSEAVKFCGQALETRRSAGAGDLFRGWLRPQRRTNAKGFQWTTTLKSWPSPTTPTRMQHSHSSEMLPHPRRAS